MRNEQLPNYTVAVEMQHDLHLALSRELLGSCHGDQSMLRQPQMIQPNFGTSKRSYTTVIESFLRFCRDFGCDADDSHASFKKAIIASIRSVDVKQAVALCDPNNAFIDYDLLAQHADINRFGDDNEWLKVVELIHFDMDAETMESDIRNSVPSVQFIVSLIGEMKLSQPISLQNMLKMYLLTNIKQLTSRHVLELFCSNLMQRDVSREVLVLTSLLADQRFGQAQFTQDVVWLLRHMRFSDSFTREYTFFQKQEKSLKDVMKQRTMQNHTRDRVRLRDRIPKSNTTKWKSQQGCSAETQEALDSFNGWISRVRFPQITTRRMKLNAYFIRCQPNIEHEPYIRKHYVEDVADIICGQPITSPEVLVLQGVIATLRMHVQPFKELVEFRRECFGGFAHKDSRGLTWLQILQFYVAAYQYKTIWAQCWTSVLPIISHQIVSDVEKFTSLNKYNGDSVVEILIKS
jgi:hypothetical protein